MASPEPAWARPSYAQAIHAALRALDVSHLVLAVHDASFPAGADDLGRGSPYSEAGREFFRFARALGFTGVQLGPQGRTSRVNPSPYDSMLFSRDPPALALAPLLAPQALDAIRAAVPPSSARLADHAGAAARIEAALTELAGAHERWAAAVEEFARAEAAWLERDAVYAACAVEFASEDWRAWPATFDAAGIAARHAGVVARYRLAQLLLQRQHRELQSFLRGLPLKLYGDLHVGISHPDFYWLQSLFLPGYKMGAPPSRTNPDGQPWNYPVLDPAQYGAGAGALVELRADKLLDAYDGLRVDHPHGLVDAWVYRDDDPRGALAAVQAGARLLSSPDLPDHPRLAALAIARPDQLERALPRHHDDWVRELDAIQVSRYAALFNRLLARVHTHGRDKADLMCEVLSTWPHPLRRVMDRERLGRLVVTQKANVDDARDVYRSDNARPGDWIMVGNHDTPPIWRVVERWHGTPEAERRARFLAERLQPRRDLRAAFVDGLVRAPAQMATALFAELFASRANHVSIFFADLFGYRQTYNAPGTVSDENWRLRVAPDYALKYARDVEPGEVNPRALSLPRALALALAADPARAAERRELIAQLSGL